jgi:hypothetical protein
MSDNDMARKGWRRNNKNFTMLSERERDNVIEKIHRSFKYDTMSEDASGIAVGMNLYTSLTNWPVLTIIQEALQQHPAGIGKIAAGSTFAVLTNAAKGR